MASQVSSNCERSWPLCVSTVRGRQVGECSGAINGMILSFLSSRRRPAGNKKALSRKGQGFDEASDLLAVVLTWPQAGRLQITTTEGTCSNRARMSSGEV